MPGPIFYQEMMLGGRRNRLVTSCLAGKAGYLMEGCMVPDPTALALLLCEQVIVDQYTRNPSPINIFTGMSVERFPSDPQRFSVFVALTDTEGEGRLELRAIRLDTGDEFYAQQYPLQFPDRATVVNVNIRVRNIRFPVSGVYEFQLLVDGSLVAQRKLRVYSAISTE